jgi:hypothetical protein
MTNDTAIPGIIRAAGDEAVKAYRSYFDDATENPRTRGLYASRARRFFEWAGRRDLTLESIDAPALAAYKAELAAALAPQRAAPYLTPVRGVFRVLADTRVLIGNPCPKGQPNGRERAGPLPAEPCISLPELKAAVHELGDWEEDSRLFQAGLVVLAPVSIGTMDPAAVAAFTGVPESLVREFAARLLASGVWRPDGKLDVWGADEGAISLSDLEITEVFFDVYIAAGHRPEGGPDAVGAPATGTPEISDDR